MYRILELIVKSLAVLLRYCCLFQGSKIHQLAASGTSLEPLKPFIPPAALTQVSAETYLSVEIST